MLHNEKNCVWLLKNLSISSILVIKQILHNCVLLGGATTLYDKPKSLIGIIIIGESLHLDSKYYVP